MQAFETADYGICGEGEIAANNLAYALENKDTDFDSIAGLVYRKDGEWTFNQPQGIRDLDILPFPDYDGFANAIHTFEKHMNYFAIKGVKEAGLIVSRSCPFQCTFCFHTTDQKYRRRSIDNVFREVDLLVNTYGVKYLMILDELFVGNKAYFDEFCDRLSEYDVMVWVQTRVDSFTKESAQNLARINCMSMSLGLESADESVLLSMRKKITLSQFVKASVIAHEYNLNPSSNLIFGDLAETTQTIDNSIAFWKKHRNLNIELSWILNLPGSYIYKEAVRRGVIKDEVEFLKDGCPQINNSSMTDEEYYEKLKEIEWLNLTKCSRYSEIEYNSVEFEAIIKRLNDNVEKIFAEHSNVALYPYEYAPQLFFESIIPAFAQKNALLINRRAALPEKINRNFYGRSGSVREVHTADIISQKGVRAVIITAMRKSVAEELKEVCKQYDLDVCVDIRDLFE